MLLERLPERGEGRQGHRGKAFGLGVASDALTDLLGIDGEELRTQLRDGATLAEIADAMHFASVAGFNTCVLRSSDRHFGYRKHIHVWLTPGDYRNANLMILLAYIIIGHDEWRRAEIDLYAAIESDADEAEGAANDDPLEELVGTLGDDGEIDLDDETARQQVDDRWGLVTQFDGRVAG